MKNPPLHQTLLRLVSQSHPLARRAQREWVRQFPGVAIGFHRMKKSAPASHQRNANYPATTKGGETAARVRAQANKLSEAERESLFKKGMQLIYGGTKETVGRR